MVKSQKDKRPFRFLQVCQCSLYISPVKERASIAEEEREIQNPQVLSLSSKSGDKKK